MELTEKRDTRISKEDARWLAEQAQKERRSTAAVIRNLIRDAREAEEAKQ